MTPACCYHVMCVLACRSISRSTVSCATYHLPNKNQHNPPKAAFILSDWLSAQSPDKEDGRAIIRTLMINNFAPRVPCFVQLAEPHSIFQVSGCGCLFGGGVCTKDGTCTGPSQHAKQTHPTPSTYKRHSSPSPQGTTCSAPTPSRWPSWGSQWPTRGCVRASAPLPFLCVVFSFHPSVPSLV